MIAHVDVEGVREAEPTSYDGIALQHAAAAEVREALQGLLPRSSARTSVDSRTNSLIVQAAPASLARIQDLVARLDSKQ